MMRAQVISFKGHNYLPPDFKPQIVNTVFNICFLPPDQSFKCKKGYGEMSPKTQPKQVKQFVFYY